MRKFTLLLLFLISSNSLTAQFFIAGGHLNGGLPVSNLKQEVDKTFFPTLSGILLYEFYNKPIQVGLEVSYGIYGTKMEVRNDLYPGYTDEFRIRRNNNYTSGMAVFRYLPSMSSKLTPFVEIQAGANYLYSRFKIRPSIFEDVVEAGKDMQDWAFAYKVGGGIQFPLPGIDGGKLELRINYQDGGTMRFLTKGDTNYLPDNGNGEFEYNPRQSPLQLITASVGIVVYDAFW
nr:outer membrane beta-barrel protein [Algoriphagus locisalis]